MRVSYDYIPRKGLEEQEQQRKEQYDLGSIVHDNFIYGNEKQYQYFRKHSAMRT